MSFLKSFLSRFSSFLAICRVVSRVHAALRSFPGFQCDVKFRAWLLENLAILSTLAIQTENTIDDIVIGVMTRVIENDKIWLVIARLIDLAEPFLIEHAEKNAIPNITYGEALTRIGETLEEERKVENPLLILSAVGLLLQIIQILRKRRLSK